MKPLKEIQSLFKDAEISKVKHLPIISAFCNRINLRQTIDLIVPSQMEVTPGEIILGMVLDTLSGRSPLYRLNEFFEGLDTQLLLGRAISPDSFNDTTVARAMDAVYEQGTMKVFSTIAQNAVSLFSCDLRYLHFDTTSVSVWGDYRESNSDGNSLTITHGHSKDKRPDLKQFLLQTLCVDRNIPIMGGAEDGNASDKAINNKTLTGISKHMARHGLKEGAFIYIADSAMVTPDNLQAVGNNLFITRLPFTYNECGRAIKDAVALNQWEDIGTIAITKPTKNRPNAHYKVMEEEVILYEKNYRAIVVHSSAHDKRREKKLKREIEKSVKTIQEQIKPVTKVEYYCRADAETAVTEIIKKESFLHKIKAEITEKIIYERGRPNKDGSKKIKETRFVINAEIAEKLENIERKKEEAGCFVLLTNVPTEGDMAHSALEILKNYKDQHGVERNFSFLKDPLIVNDLFLKKTRRVEVLGMILIIALLVWNLIERAMRQYVEDNNTPLPGWDKKMTKRPTSFMMTTKFTNVCIIRIGNYRQIANGLNTIQKQYLSALNLTADIFINHLPGG